MNDKLRQFLITEHTELSENLTEEHEKLIELGWNASREITLKAVGEWLDRKSAYRAPVSPSEIELPFLNPIDYETFYLALKRGEFPEG